MDDKKVFDTNKYKEFIRIVRELNLIGITPVLMGSLGLEFTTGVSWNAQDIDIHVPEMLGVGKHLIKIVFINGMKLYL